MVKGFNGVTVLLFFLGSISTTAGIGAVGDRALNLELALADRLEYERQLPALEKDEIVICGQRMTGLGAVLETQISYDDHLHRYSSTFSPFFFTDIVHYEPEKKHFTIKSGVVNIDESDLSHIANGNFVYVPAYGIKYTSYNGIETNIVWSAFIILPDLRGKNALQWSMLLRGAVANSKILGAPTQFDLSRSGQEYPPQSRL